MDDTGNSFSEAGDSQRHRRLGKRKFIPSGKSIRYTGERIFRLVMLWRNSPIHRRGRRGRLNSASWLANDCRRPLPPVLSVPGNSHNPARSPLRIRCRSRTFPSRRRIASGHSTSRIGAVFLVRKRFACRSIARVAQRAASGHRGQRGILATQIVAPSSIKPWLKYPGRDRGTSAAAAFRNSLSFFGKNRRCKTRWALPSTAG